MTFNIDTVIFFIFLLANLYFGLKFSVGVKTLKQYAIGDRDFNSYIVAGTIIATWICGEFFYTIVTETYKEGLYFLLSDLGNTICFLLVGWLFLPRMSQFLGKISIAEVMGELYGIEVRVLTAIAGFISVTGIIAVQLKIAGFIFEHTLNIPYYYGIILSSFVITFYSALGGIKAVTFTDLIQFTIFMAIIPIFTYTLFRQIGDIDAVIEYAKQDAHYNLSSIFNFYNKKSWSYFSLALFMIIPSFNNVIFQRISMSKNIHSCQRSFYISAFVILFLTIVVAWLGIVLKVYNPNIADKDFLKTIINYLPPIYKSLFLIGIMAAIMSTADSYINSSSVLITHDVINVFIKVKNELLIARIIAVFLGAMGTVLSLKETSLLQLVVSTCSLYMVTITVPFIMAVFGYQTCYKQAVLWGMGIGLFVFLGWQHLEIIVIDALVPAMLANLVTIVIIHKYCYIKGFTNKNNKSS